MSSSASSSPERDVPVRKTEGKRKRESQPYYNMGVEHDSSDDEQISTASKPTAPRTQAKAQRPSAATMEVIDEGSDESKEPAVAADDLPKPKKQRRPPRPDVNNLMVKACKLFVEFMDIRYPPNSTIQGGDESTGWRVSDAFGEHWAVMGLVCGPHYPKTAFEEFALCELARARCGKIIRGHERNLRIKEMEKAAKAVKATTSTPRKRK